MSECVVRMERVPKNCDDGCWGMLSGECPWCDSIDGYKMVGNRPPNCPIIAVLPDGHGRLVDADALKQWFIEQIDCYKRFDGPNCSMMVYAYEDVCQVINDAPTIFPAEAERSET